MKIIQKNIHSYSKIVITSFILLMNMSSAMAQYTPAMTWAEPKDQQIYAVDISRDGKMIAVGSDSGLTIWDSESGEIILRMSDLHISSSVYDVDFSPDDQYVAFALYPLNARIINIKTGEQIFFGIYKINSWNV